MRLVVVGAYTLDVLQTHVMESFSDVPQSSKPSPHTSDDSIKCCGWEHIYESQIQQYGMPFASSCMGKVFYIAPVKDCHILMVTWQLPPQLDYWKSKPCDYLAHLIGHEAKGSLLANLKSKSWATGCWAGVGSEGYQVHTRK